jgi:hypothetical protein
MRRPPFPGKGIGVRPETVQKNPGKKPVPQPPAVTGAGMAHHLVAHLEALVFQPEPFAAPRTAHGFPPLKKGGQNHDEENRRTGSEEDFGVAYEDEEFVCGQRNLL